jgi:hypothetical protein
LRRSIPILACVALAVVATAWPAEAARDRLDLRRASLELPGPPAKVLPCDLDGDAHADLAVVVGYTEIEETGAARVEDMVEVMTVVPALLDRREVRAYLGSGGGSYRHAATLALPTSVLHLEDAGAMGLIALTDAGLSRLRFVAGAGSEKGLALEPLLEDEPILAGTESFYSTLSLAHDLDGDGDRDVLFPSLAGPTVWLWDGTSLDRVSTLALPAADEPGARRWQPIPDVLDVNGDGAVDLAFRRGIDPDVRGRIHVFLGDGAGGFRPLRAEARDCHDERSDLRLASSQPGLSPWPQDVVALRDVTGDGRAELVLALRQARGHGLRKGLADAKRPVHLYRFHSLTKDGDVTAAPFYGTEMVGHAFEGESESLPFPLVQFQDLDGDGREELVTVTLRFSMFGVLRALVTKQIKVGIDFHVYRQTEHGHFVAVPGLDLSEELKLELDNLRFGRFAQFAGDFDGDGRNDFVHLGRGAQITVHRGGPGCTYPKKPDLTIDVGEEPESLDLVRIEDLDGDGRSDVRIARPGSSDDPDVTAPVRLDLFLSGAGR